MGCVPAFAAGAATTTTLTITSGGVTIASGGTVVSPAQVTLTATVLAGATPVTKGTVYFCNSTAPVCSDINLIGQAQLTTAGTASFTFVPPITAPNAATPPVTTPHSYKAVFLPTVADAGSSSAASTLFVNGTFPTSSVLTEVQTAANPPPYVYTLTDTVTATTQAYPTGTVTFYDTSDVLTPGSAGPPVVPPIYLALGTAPIVTGTSSFVLKAQPLVASANLPRYVAVGDLNGDGIPDIAVSDFGINATTNTSTVDIYFGKGDGTFTAGPLLHVSAGDGPQFTLLGDFNNDGCLDVITESYSANALYLFLNTKTAGVCTGTFGAATTITNGAIYGPGGIGVGDFNGDGNLDIVVANNSSPSTNPSTGTTSNIFYGNGAGGFTLGGNLTPGGTINPQFSAIADYNGDGFLDIAVANNATDTINIYLNSAATPGTFTLKQTLATTAGNIIILPADVNKDGKVDLVVSTSSTTAPINVWTGNGDGTFTAGTNPPVTGTVYSSIAVADFNGDGNVDIITTTNPGNGGTNTPGTVSVLLGNGTGTFQAPTATQPNEGVDTLSLAVADFNGDGYADVVLANFSSNNLAVYLAGYQTTGTATANLPGVTVYGETVNPHLADAVFPTNTIYTTSTSNTVPLIPNILPGTAPYETLTMTATPVTTDYGQQVALQATFTYINLGPSYQPNGGTVTFYQVATNGNLTVLGTATLGTVANPGCSTVTAGNPSVTTTTCTSTILNTTTLPIGTDKLEASFNLVSPPNLPAAPATNGSNANFTGLISPTVNVTVGQVSGSADTVAASPNPTAYGQPTTLTFCIPVGTGTNLGANVPSGTVQFSYGTPATNINAPVTIGTTPTTFNGTSCYLATTTTTALPTGNDTVTAAFTAGANSGYASASPTVAVAVAKAPVVNPTDPLLSQSFVANPTTQVFGGAVGLTYTIPVAAGNAAPTGPVTFTDGTQALGSCGNAGNPPVFTAGSTFVFQGVTYTNYSCKISTTALPVGPQTVTATYTTTDPNYAGGTATPAPPPLTALVNVSAGTASSTLTAGPNPTTYGTTVTITETLVPINGVCPTAPVSFYSGGTVNNGVNTGGTLITTTAGTVNPATVVANPAAPNATTCTASIQTNSLPVGTTSVTATAPANGSFAAVGSGPLPVTINQDAAADTLATTPNPSTFGQPVTITDTVPNAPNGTAATGTVQFYDYTTPIGTPQPVTNGVATLITSTLPVGTDSITGVYSGDTNFASVTSNAVNQIVNPVATTPTLSAAPNPTTFGTTVTIQEQIPVVNGTAPTGTVTFYYELPGSTTQVPIGTFNLTATSGGIATVTTSTLPVGVDNLYASYAGNSNYAAVTSGPDPETVNKAIGPDTLAIAPNPSQFASTTPVVATDTIPTVGGVAPTGTVTFYDNGPTGTNLGTFPVVNGVATLSTTTLPVGTQPITAVYNGDGNYGVVTSNTVNEVIAPGNTVPALSANPNPTTFGTPVTLTEQIPGLNGVTPTGTVTFTYTPPGSTTPVTIATNVTVKNGVATATISTLPIGVDAVTAVYSGDTNYTTATNHANVTVGLATGTDTIVGSPNPTNSGTAVTFTYTVPVVNGVTPTGTVTFYNGTTAFTGTTTPFNAAGQTTITTSTLPTGVLTITGKYPGDNTYAAGTASTTETINAITGGDTVTVSPNPTTFGSPVTISFCIPAVAGTGSPTGTVTFSTGGITINAPVTIGTTVVNGCYLATTSTTGLPVGAPTTVTGTYTPGPASPYGPGAPTGTVTVGPVNPASVITYGPSSPTCSTTLVTLTDTITPVNGVVPTGTVQFYATVNGVATALGTPQTVVPPGVATLTIALPCGTTGIYAIYKGNSPYGGSTTPTVPLSLADFTIAATPPTQTVNPGDTAVYTVNLAGAGGVAFTSPVTLTATGLPPGATVTFGTPTYVPGVGPTPTTMTIVTSPTVAGFRPANGSNIYYGLLLLPLLGIRRIRRKIRALPKGITYGLAALLLLGGLGAMTGCSGGYFGGGPNTYTITVTGTSGTLSHSTTVTLTLE